MLKKILCVCLCFAFVSGFFTVYADNAEIPNTTEGESPQPVGEEDKNGEGEPENQPEVCIPCGREIQLKAEIYDLLARRERLNVGIRVLNRQIAQKERELRGR